VEVIAEEAPLVHVGIAWPERQIGGRMDRAKREMELSEPRAGLVQCLVVNRPLVVGLIGGVSNGPGAIERFWL